jgi:hypothetical protein
LGLAVTGFGRESRGLRQCGHLGPLWAKVDPYFSIPMPDHLVRWRRASFLLRNDIDTPLPAFTGGHPIPHPNWEYGVAWADLHRLQPLLEIV